MSAVQGRRRHAVVASALEAELDGAGLESRNAEERARRAVAGHRARADLEQRHPHPLLPRVGRAPLHVDVVGGLLPDAGTHTPLDLVQRQARLPGLLPREGAVLLRRHGAEAGFTLRVHERRSVATVCDSERRSIRGVRCAAMADLSFDGKVAIITGAGGGLGREHALLLASRGGQVVVNDLGGSVSGEGGSAGPAQTVAKEIEDAGGVAVADTNSVSTPEGGEAIVNTAVEAFGRVDIVINNAGILRDKTFHNMTDDLLTPVLDVHLKGAFYVTRPAWVRMREQGYGRVVNTSSNSGILGNFGQSNYGAAKMGLVGLTRVLSAEGAKHNIKVNAVAPVARTRMTEEILGPLADRLDPKLVSPLVAWLCHEDCPVTGEVYSAAGGRIARFFIGLTPGYYNADLSLEDVRDHWGEIRAEDAYIVPSGPGDEFGQLMKHFG